MHPSLQKIRGILLNMGLLLLTLGLLIAFGEWFLRWSGLQPMHPMPALYQKSSVPGLEYEMRPLLDCEHGFGRECVSTNSMGLRSKERQGEKPLIAVLGDSMTFGFGVEDAESNPAVLQQYFPDFDVLNAGVNGYNIEQEVLLYEAKVRAQKPALVILEFVINDADPKIFVNDEGLLTTGQFTKQEEQQRLRQAITGTGTIRFPGKYFLHTKSAIFTFLERRTKGLPFRSHGSIFGNEWNDAQFLYYETWFKRLNADLGDTPKLLVIWPDGWLHPETTQRITMLADRYGWNVLDLADDMGRSFRTLGWDHHPTAAVHARAAWLIAETIKRMQLLPE